MSRTVRTLPVWKSLVIIAASWGGSAVDQVAGVCGGLLGE